MNFTGKIVLITGASRGIGFGIARGFAAAGASLHLLADDVEVREAARCLGAIGHVADITNEAEVSDILGGIPHIDILINNAGWERATPLDDLSAETLGVFRRVLDINIAGTYIVTRQTLTRMQAGGRIISTASVWGRVGEPLFGAYVASKHAIIGLTKAWAKELGPCGINVNAVAPGWVKTDAALRSLSHMAVRRNKEKSELLDEILGSQALPGLMQPDDMQGAYMFLASEHAANITGQTLGADRGEVPY